VVRGNGTATAWALLDTYHDTEPGGFFARRSRGTSAAPSAVLSGDDLGSYFAGGYGATGFGADSGGGMAVLAAENWTDAAQGTHVTFETTPTGGVLSQERMRITAAGNVGIGTTAATYMLDVLGTTRLQRASSQYVTVDLSGGALQLNLNDGSTASPRITMGTGAGTATFETTSNLSLNQDVAGTLFNLRTYNTAATVLLDRITVAGRIDTADIAFMNSEVGVGVNTPQNRLDVKGAAVIGNAYAGVNVAPASGLLVEGNVGIGTTSAGARLEVSATGAGAVVAALLRANPGGTGPSNLAAAVLENTFGSSNLKTELKFRAVGADRWGLGADFDGNGTQNFYLYDNIAGAARLFMDSAGNLGIGTNSPQAKLDVTGRLLISAASDASGNIRFTSATPYIWASSYFLAPGGAYFNSGPVYCEAALRARNGIFNDTITNYNGDVGIADNLRMNDNAIYLRGGTDVNHGIQWTVAAPDGPVLFGWDGIKFQKMNGGAGALGDWNTSRLYVNGNIAIGTTSPGAILHARAATPALRVDGTTGARAYDLRVTGAGDFEVFDQTGGAARLTIQPGGRVGIGRNPLTNALEVQGEASKLTSGGWLANSDRRIKMDIEALDHPLDVLNRLRPVRFRYTDAHRARNPQIRDVFYYNFIAQEYREVFPDSVKDDGSGLLQVDTYNTTPYLVAAVQELDRRDAKAASEIAALKAENAALRARLDEIERWAPRSRAAAE
jgi:hypothetical protein